MHLQLIHIHTHGFILGPDVLDRHLLYHAAVGGDAVFCHGLVHHVQQLIPGDHAVLHRQLQGIQVHFAALASLQDHDHGQSKGLVQGVQLLRIYVAQLVVPVFIGLVALLHQRDLVVLHKEHQLFQAVGPDLLRRHLGNAALLDAHVHNVAGIGGQGQVAERLHHQQSHNGQHRFPVRP